MVNCTSPGNDEFLFTADLCGTEVENLRISVNLRTSSTEATLLGVESSTKWFSKTRPGATHLNSEVDFSLCSNPSDSSRRLTVGVSSLASMPRYPAPE